LRGYWAEERVQFSITPEEAQPIARWVARHLRKTGAKVVVERAPFVGAPYRPTLIGTIKGKTIAVEAQGALAYTRPLQEFNAWLKGNRHYVELFVATGVEAQAAAGVIADLDRDGIGLLVVGDRGGVEVTRRAQNPALVVQPDPTLRYGDCAREVGEAIAKFNRVDRKDGLRDMCELVERETERLAERAAKRGRIIVPVASVLAKDWSEQIDTLASTNACAAGHAVLLGAGLKHDCHSFRGARNLVDHKVRSKREDTRRQRQFAERMVQGPRLVSELVAIRRSIR
jgi:hypothetical protein